LVSAISVIWDGKLVRIKMSDKIVWTQRPAITDRELILLCLRNAPCGTDKKQVDKLIKHYENLK